VLTGPAVARQVNIPLWALVHFPVIVTITTAMFTPKVRRPEPPLHRPDGPARAPPWQPCGAGRVLAGRTCGAKQCRRPCAQTDGAARARQGWLHCILYVLFENAMGIVKLWACVAGELPPRPQRRCRARRAHHAACCVACATIRRQPPMLACSTRLAARARVRRRAWRSLTRARAHAGILDLKQANEWVVTTKLGSSDKRPGTGAAPAVRDCKMYLNEMMMSTFVLTAAFYGIFSVNKWSFSIFLTLQGALARVARVGLRCVLLLACGSVHLCLAMKRKVSRSQLQPAACAGPRRAGCHGMGRTGAGA
jgi:hypothetical protein